MTLRLRLSLAAVLLLAVVSLLGVLLISSIGSSELSQVDQQLRSSLPLASTIDQGSPPLIHSTTSPPRTVPANHFSAFYIAVVTGTHRDVISTPLDAHNAPPQLPSTVTTSRKDIRIFTVSSVSGSQTWRAVLIARANSHSELLVAVSLSHVDMTMSRLRLALLLAGLVVLAVVAATGYWIARLGLRPIAEVTEVADAISAGDRARRVTTARGMTEAGKLARAFNMMLDEQLSLEERLRQFVSDASHELRTPVSVILGITELWRQGELRDGEQRDEAIHRIGQSGRQMGKLVEELLLLAHLDEGRPLGRSPADLAHLIRDVVADASTTDPQRSISVDVPGSLVVHGDAYALRQVVTNLVTNALRHTPAASAIGIHLSMTTDTALLSVEDSGPGMTPEQASHAFDRFWQADASRSRSSAGLGLSIVRAIVVAHAGDVTIDTDPLRGTRVSVVLPLGEEGVVDVDEAALSSLG